MAGHSKWANIKRRKGAQDAVRGKIFTKLNREIMVASKIGGGDQEANPRLRQAIAKARSEKGTGDLEGVNYEEIIYEGYGPAGVAVLVETLTDNRNRTVSDIRSAFTKNNGNLGEAGCVSWIFHMRSYFVFAKEDIDGDHLVEVALEAGAEDINEEGPDYEVTGPPENFDALKNSFTENGLQFQVGEVTMLPQNVIKLDDKQAVQTLKLVEALEAGAEDINEEGSDYEVTGPPENFDALKNSFTENDLQFQVGEVTMLPQNVIKLDDKQAVQTLKLVEALEDSDDVQKVFANFDIPDDVMENI
jgi:YebC/PmpR family DNA-binding regulatory protein